MITLKKQHRGYKSCKEVDSIWFDRIPISWREGKVTRFTIIKTGGTPNREILSYWENGSIPWMSSGEVNKGIVRETDNKITEDGFRNSNATLLPVHSVMIALNGQGKTKGMSAILEIEATCNQSLAALICDEKNLHYKFLYYYLQIQYRTIRGLVGDDARDGLNMSTMKEIFMPIPTLEEQVSIASYLDEKCALIDRVIEGKKKQIEILEEQRAAIINQAVMKGLDESVEMKESGVEWIGEIPKEWQAIRLSKLTTKMTNGFVGPTRNIFFDSGVKYLQSLHIKNNHIIFDTEYYVSEKWSNEHSKSILWEGDLLFVQTGDIGQVALVTKDFEGSNCHALIITRPNKKYLLPEYLVWYFLSSLGKEQLIAHQTGAMHPHLNCRVIKYIPVIIPSKKEQLEIAEFLEVEDSKIRKTIGLVEHSISVLNEYKTSLISHVVTGKIDISHTQ